MGKLPQPTGVIVPTIPAGPPPSPLSTADPVPTASPVPTAGPVPTADPRSRELVRRLELSGLQTPEAGNVVAYLLGLRPVASGWRASELDHLRFLRALVADGRLES